MNAIAIWLLAGLALGMVLFSAARGEEPETAEVDLTSGPHAKAIFAGGCFWCMEPPFERLDGVHAVISGYVGGEESKPTYKQVSSGQTGHTEAILIEYDPQKISYEKLLEVFWRNIDPTQRDGQFFDLGTQYRTGIFYLDEEQKALAEESRRALARSGRFERPIVTEISPATRFYRAEEYHQDYHKKNPEHYHRYRQGSGRDRFIQKHWGSGK